MATALGRTVPELEKALPASSDLTEAMAYYELEPYGAWRDNYHIAILATLIANAGKKHPTAKPDDFMLRDEHAQRERQTATFIKGLMQRAKKKDG